MVGVRPNLEGRTGLSKSALTSFEVCSAKAWEAKHNPRPWIPNPRMTFGSAVDAGVELLLTYARAGQVVDLIRASEAAGAIMERDKVEIDLAEARLAFESFVSPTEKEPLAPIDRFDWHHALLQEHIHVPLWNLGDFDGHPDWIVPPEEDASGVWGEHIVGDIKTSTRAKRTAKSLELGSYAVAREAQTGKTVTTVCYMTWVRTKSPYWQILTAEVSAEFRRWTRERIAAYVRADRADDYFAARMEKMGLPPENFAFPGGPRSSSLCLDCQFNPKYGGACRIAPQEEVPDDE